MDPPRHRIDRLLPAGCPRGVLVLPARRLRARRRGAPRGPAASARAAVVAGAALKVLRHLHLYGRRVPCVQGVQGVQHGGDQGAKRVR